MGKVNEKEKVRKEYADQSSRDTSKNIPCLHLNKVLSSDQQVVGCNGKIYYIFNGFIENSGSNLEDDIAEQ